MVNILISPSFPGKHNGINVLVLSIRKEAQSDDDGSFT